MRHLAIGAILTLSACVTPDSGVRATTASRHDTSPPLAVLADAGATGVDAADCGRDASECGLAPPRDDAEPALAPVVTARPVSPQSASVEQTSQGQRPPILMIESFDGHGFGLVGPHGTGRGNNPSDNSLAVGPNHIFETVNSLTAIYTRKGELYDTTGRVIFGPIGHNVVWNGFGGECERTPNGDTVVRYDQLADRWLIVMPRFNRAPAPPGSPPGTQGPYGMCYAISTGPNPLGPYHRYYFERELFPDYPRPAIWPDGYYIPTSTGDNLLPDGRLPEKHACVAERDKMLLGLPAAEQCLIIPESNFLNNADIDGKGLPPAGAPNIMIASGGTQLRNIFRDDGIYVYKFHVDWVNRGNTRVDGPAKIAVAPYNYLCDGQLTRCVPQPGTDNRLDAQGDKIMQRVVYRNIEGRESIVAVHSVNTAAGAGGVRWYEFRFNASRDLVLHQQGTFAPDSNYRWMASPGIDRQGNIAFGYSYGGATVFPGQRFVGRLADDPPGKMGFRETVMVEGGASQMGTNLRWQDYTTLAMDPTDDCTFWYQGDYYKPRATGYTVRIGAFRVPGCRRGSISGSVFYDANRNGMRDANEAGFQGVQVNYAGVRGARDVVAPPSSSVSTSAAGEFRVSLPADSAYFNPVYSVSSGTPAGTGWSRTGTGTAYGSGFSIRMENNGYNFTLGDRDDVTRLDFGLVCSVRNRGGATVAFWTGDAGRRLLAANDPAPPTDPGRGARGGGGRGRGGPPAWRPLINNTRFLVTGDGARFGVPVGTPFDSAYTSLRAWLSGNTSGVSQQLSVQLALTSLNVMFGGQAGNATLQDPVTREWTTIAALLTRISTFIQESPTISAAAPAAGAATSYRELLQSLNGNSAQVTPATAAECGGGGGGGIP